MWLVGKGANLEPFGAYEGGFLVLAKGDRYRNLGALDRGRIPNFSRLCEWPDPGPFAAWEREGFQALWRPGRAAQRYLQPFKFLKKQTHATL